MLISWLEITEYPDGHFSTEITNKHLPRKNYMYALLTAIAPIVNSNYIPKHITFTARIPYSNKHSTTKTLSNPKEIFLIPKEVEDAITTRMSYTEVKDEFLAMQEYLHHYGNKRDTVVYYKTMYKLLDTSIRKGMKCNETARERSTLIYENNKLEWIASYSTALVTSDKYNTANPYLVCQRCNKKAWLNIPVKWKLYPAANILYIKHDDMPKLTELPRCKICLTNTSFNIIPRQQI